MPAFRDPPVPTRPVSPPPSYGVPAEGGEMTPWSFVVDRLRAETVYWAATVRPDGRPHAMPIWGVLVDDDLYVETSPATRKARNLAANPAIVVHVGGDEAVIVEGTATPFRPRGAAARRIAAAFAGKYPGYRPAPVAWDDGSLFRVEPRTVFAWRDMPTATRWRFDRP